jgi:hypothetical protein
LLLKLLLLPTYPTDFGADKKFDALIAQVDRGGHLYTALRRLDIEVHILY